MNTGKYRQFSYPGVGQFIYLGVTAPSGAFVPPVDEGIKGGGLPEYHQDTKDRFKEQRERITLRRLEIEDQFSILTGEKRLPELEEVQNLKRLEVIKSKKAIKPKTRRNLRKQIDQLAELEAKVRDYEIILLQQQENEGDFMQLIEIIETQERLAIMDVFLDIRRTIH